MEKTCENCGHSGSMHYNNLGKCYIDGLIPSCSCKKFKAKMIDPLKEIIERQGYGCAPGHRCKEAIRKLKEEFQERVLHIDQARNELEDGHEEIRELIVKAETYEDVIKWIDKIFGSLSK